MTETMLNQTQLAKALGVSTETIRKMVRDKQITKYHTVRKSKRYLLSEVLAETATRKESLQ